jgi:concentrative nucleoside transporter, CNT family
MATAIPSEEKKLATTPPAAAAAAETPGSGMRRNSDPALEHSHQHHHEHLHHDKGIVPEDEEPSYTKGTTPFSPSLIPDQDPIHHHHNHAHINGDEKGAERKSSNEPPDYSDPEKVNVVTHGEEDEGEKPNRFRRFYKHYRIGFHIFIFCLFTGWWIASLVLHRNDKNWVIPFLFWLCIVLRLLFFHIPISYVSRPIKWVWQHTAVVVYDRIPPKFRTPAGAIVTVAVILVGSFASGESADNTRENRAVSLFGLAVIIFILWLTSKNRKLVNWRPVIGGMLAQYIIALFVLRTSVGFDIFKFISDRASDLLGFANEGTAFLTAPSVLNLHWFLTGVIPPIIFFVSLVQVLYYIGFLQWFIKKFATFVFWALNVSGAEAVVAAATPFIGQGESAMLVRPFIAHMTNAEIHQIMCCGFATISGSVLVAYISLGLNAQAMVSSCIMSIPASLAISKLRYPETEETLTAGNVVIPDDDEHKASNVLHAFANGAWLGIKIAGTIVASLLCILAAIGLINGLLTWWGGYLNINNPPLTIQLIVGYICYPIAFLLGVPRNGDLYKVAQLIGIKIIAVSIPSNHLSCPRKSQMLTNGSHRTSTSPSAP